MPREQDANRLHRRKGADHSRHGAQHAVRRTGIAIIGIEGIPHEAAIAGLARQIPEMNLMPVSATQRGLDLNERGANVRVR